MGRKGYLLIIWLSKLTILERQVVNKIYLTGVVVNLRPPQVKKKAYVTNIFMYLSGAKMGCARKKKKIQHQKKPQGGGVYIISTNFFFLFLLTLLSFFFFKEKNDLHSCFRKVLY